MQRSGRACFGALWHIQFFVKLLLSKEKNIILKKKNKEIKYLFVLLYYSLFQRFQTAAALDLTNNLSISILAGQISLQAKDLPQELYMPFL